MTKDDEVYMRKAIELAKNGEGFTNPNPLVGAVLVKNGAIIGSGFHHRYGELHAEREALLDCKKRGNDAKGATIYVTLEPCCHFGKQPPCTQAILEAGIKRVVVGSRDPNPLVHGKGNSFLRENGVIIEEDFLRDECDSLNPIFFHYITTRTPYIALKYAMTMDGKIATKSGKSKWITNESSREFVHKLRNRYAGIMCGIGTVLADNPMLDCRLQRDKVSNPIRIICDSNLRIPLDSNIVKTAKDIHTIVCCSKDNQESKKVNELTSAGIEVNFVEKDENDHIDLKQLVSILGEKKIDSILIEGGSELNYSALKCGLVNHIYEFIAPKIFGGIAKSPIGGKGIDEPMQSFDFKLVKTTLFDGDIMLEYEALKL